VKNNGRTKEEEEEKKSENGNKILCEYQVNDLKTTPTITFHGGFLRDEPTYFNITENVTNHLFRRAVCPALKRTRHLLTNRAHKPPTDSGHKTSPPLLDVDNIIIVRKITLTQNDPVHPLFHPLCSLSYTNNSENTHAFTTPHTHKTHASGIPLNHRIRRD
jgi:hypothetical protein